MKRALLLIAHGSRRLASNDEIRELAKRLSINKKNNFDLVMPAFLELAEPSIPDGIQACVEQGSSEVVVFPYFLSAGRHVVQDIPTQVKEKQKQFPNINIVITSYLGMIEGVSDLILDHLQSKIEPVEPA